MKWWVNNVLCDSPDVAIKPVTEDEWLTEVRVRQMRGPSAPDLGFIIEVEAGGKLLFLQVTESRGTIALWHDHERMFPDTQFPNILRLDG